MKLRSLLLSCLLLALSIKGYTQTTLGAGDIAFVCYDADGDDGFAIVILKEICGSVTTPVKIYFNDNEWDGNAFPSTTERELTWTVETKIKAGTVVTFSGSSSNIGTLSGGTIDLAGSNEVIYAFTGSDNTTPTTFISAIANNGFTDSNGTLTGTGLTDGSNAINIGGSEDVGAYTGDRTGMSPFSSYLSKINSPSSWMTADGTGDQTDDVPCSATSFEGCPSFAANAPGIATISQSSCTVIGGTPSSGSVSAPGASCPTGSTLMYSVDGGTTFADTVPDYNQTSSITIETACFCNENDCITSDTFSITTVPGICPICPDNLADTIPKLITFTNSSCSVFGGSPAGGKTTVPADNNCPTGSTLKYSVDNGATFTDTLPDYNQNTPLTILTTCFCDMDDSMTSDTSMVTTKPGTCPSCPDLSGSITPIVFSITESSCNTAMGMPMGGKIDTSMNKCPNGSSLVFSVDDDAFSTALPNYNQTTAQKIEATCACISNNAKTSDTIVVTTSPNTTCPAVLTTLSFMDPCSCTDPLNCEQAGVYYFHDTLTITGSMAGLKIGISAATDFLIGSCGSFVVATSTNADSIPETSVGSGVYKLEFWRPSGVIPTVSVIESGMVTPVPATTFSPACIVCPPPTPVPTIGEWGVMTLGLLLMILGVVCLKAPRALLRQKQKLVCY